MVFIECQYSCIEYSNLSILKISTIVQCKKKKNVRKKFGLNNITKEHCHEYDGIGSLGVKLTQFLL